MNLKQHKGLIFIIAIVLIIGGYSLWINVLRSTIPEGDSYTFTDTIGDKYTIKIDEVEYNLGIMTVTLHVDYDLLKDTEEKNKMKVEAAVKMFFVLNDARLENNGVAYNPISVNSEAFMDYDSYKWATAKLNFLVDDNKQYTLNIKSDQDTIKFALK